MTHETVQFRVVRIEREQRETTTWTDTTHCLDNTGLHIVLKRSVDRRERHLHGSEAAEFLRLLGAPECFRVSPVPA